MNKKAKFSETGKTILNRNKIASLEEFFQADPQADIKAIENIPVKQIKPNPNQARKYFNDAALEDLSHSIKENGVLQPVLVNLDAEKNIILVAGERRLRASQSLGRKTIPAIFVTGNPLEISLIENIQRENLKPLEEAEAYARMISDFGYTQQQISKVIGKARSTIAETLSLNRLPDKIKQNCRHADIPKRTLVEVAKAGNQDKMIRLFNKISTEKINSEKIRKITREPRIKGNKRTTGLLKAVKAAAKELSELQIKDMSEQEYLELIAELDKLKTLIGNIFS
jgi:ParB family chromosome partitioning protein